MSFPNLKCVIGQESLEEHTTFTLRGIQSAKQILTVLCHRGQTARERQRFLELRERERGGGRRGERERERERGAETETETERQ